MMLKWLNLPENASSFGAEIDHMLVAVHWLMLAMMVAWGFFYVYSLIAFRGKPKDPSSRKAFPFKFVPYLMVFSVAAIEFFLMFSTDIPFWINLRTNFPKAEESVQVQVIAEQFAWNFHYTGPDGKFGRIDRKLIDVSTNPIGLDPKDEAGKDDVVTINQMYVPNNKAVIVDLTAKDVLHSFGLPNFRVKQDAIPGENVRLWFKPIKEGKFDIACSQLCGIGHYRMQGFVNVQSQEAFDKWLAEQVAAKQSQGQGDSFWN